MTEDDQFRARLEQAGEEEVHRKLARGDYAGPHGRKREIAQAWLAQKNQERQDNEPAAKANRVAWFNFGSVAMATIIAAAALAASVVGWSK
jgi:hypothetical protein